MKTPYFGRVLTAMITPFNPDGSVNLAATKALVEWWLDHGSDGLVVTGSTGEALSHLPAALRSSKEPVFLPRSWSQPLPWNR